MTKFRAADKWCRLQYFLSNPSAINVLFRAQCDLRHFLDVDLSRSAVFWRPFQLTLRQPPTARRSDSRKQSRLPILGCNTGRAVRCRRMASRPQGMGGPKHRSAYPRIRDVAECSRELVRTIIGGYRLVVDGGATARAHACPP